MLDLSNSHNLEQTLVLNLFKVNLLSGIQFCICDKYEVTFMGDTYGFMANELTGMSEAEGTEKSRPNWSVANPNNALHSVALSGELEGGLVTRYQVAVSDLGTGSSVRTDVWQIYQVVGVSTYVALKLRALTDIPSASVPPRGYFPPDFPSVS